MRGNEKDLPDLLLKVDAEFQWELQEDFLDEASFINAVDQSICEKIDEEVQTEGEFTELSELSNSKVCNKDPINKVNNEILDKFKDQINEKDQKILDMKIQLEAKLKELLELQA